MGAEQKESWETTRVRHVSRSCRLLNEIVMGEAPMASVYPPLARFGAGPRQDFLPLLTRILTVIAAHSRDEKGFESGWRAAYAWTEVPGSRRPANGPRTDRFRMRLVAALFRFADELDVSHVRVPNVLRLLEAAVENPSLLYWVSCYFAANVVIDEAGRSFRLLIDKAKMPADPALQELAEFLVRNMVHDKLRRSFVKGSTRETPSIQRILLEHGLALVMEDPELIAGPPPPEVSEAIEQFLGKALDYLRGKGFSGTVPFRSYAIRGAKVDREFATESRREVRRVRVIDETAAVRVPGPLKESFARAQNLHSSRCLTFLSTKQTGDGEVLAFSESGQRTTAATSAVLAAAAHLDRPSVKLSSAGASFHVTQSQGIFAVDLGKPQRPFSSGRGTSTGGLRIRNFSARWQQFTAFPKRTGPAATAMVGYAVRLCGVHGVLWPPDFEFDPRLRNFFDESTTPPASRRKLWMERAALLERHARELMRTLPLRFATVSILEEAYPYRLLTYSSDSDSCVTFSGGAVAAAGSFALEHPTLVDGEGSLRRDGRTDEFDLSVWYDRSHLFQVVKTADAIRLICSVKHISEGRLFQ